MKLLELLHNTSYDLVRYEVSNYKSIKDSASVSFEASSDMKTLPNNVFKPEYFSTMRIEKNNERFTTKRLIKSIFIFGNNGTGKSSFINSLLHLKDLIIRNRAYSMRDEYDEDTDAFSFMHKSNKDSNIPIRHSISFYVSGVEYNYVLAYDKRGYITEEALSYSPLGRSTKVFNRVNSTISVGKSFEELKYILDKSIKENIPLLSTAYLLSNNSTISNAYDFFRKGIITEKPRAMPMSIKLSRLIQEKENNIQQYNMLLDILRMAEFDVLDIYMEESLSFLDENDSEEAPRRPRKRIMISYKDFDIPIEEESDGFKWIIRLAIKIISTIKNNSVLIIDELENSIHNNTVKKLVNYFHEKSEYGQILAATHATEIMDFTSWGEVKKPLLRREQIYIATINKNRETKISPLLSLSKLRATDTNIRAKYLDGTITSGLENE